MASDGEKRGTESSGLTARARMPLLNGATMHKPVDSPENPCVLLGPAPCDDCPFRARCEVELLACESYSLFVRDLARWDEGAREPSHARYLAVFDVKKDQPSGSQLRWLRPPASDALRNPSSARPGG